MKYTFNKIKVSSKISNVCKKCGKKRTRTISNYQTLNPFNKNKEGKLKNTSEIREELEISVSKKIQKLKKYFICASCQNNS